MEKSRLKLAAALVATLGFTMHGTANAADNTQRASTLGNSGLQIVETGDKCEKGASCKKGHKHKAAKGAEGSCKGKEGSCKGAEKGKEGSCKGKEGSCKGKEGSCKGKEGSCKGKEGAGESK